MLEPEYFNDKADRMIEIYRELEDFIMHDIADRLLKSQSVSGTADRMMWKLQQMGESRAEIMNKLSRITGLSKKELKVLLQDAVMTSWSDDLQTFKKLGIEVTNPLENMAVASVMNAEYIKSQGELENLTRTAMNQSVQDLLQMLDEADMRVASGMQSYSSAICDILDRYAGKGLMIDYPTGTKRTLEAAVRMCVVTSMNQTSAQITNKYITEGRVEYVLVSAHMGARTQKEGFPYLSGHENWQGKVYRIRGSEEGFPNLLEMTGYDIDENGRGRVVNPLGLHGYNCRHSHKPWDKELKNPYTDENGNPKIDMKENSEQYEAQQKQRQMERAIRKTKRELLMKQNEIDGVAEVDVREMLQPEYDKLSYRLKEQNEAYNKFCEENGLQKHSDRLKVTGFKRKQAVKTSARARAYERWDDNKKSSQVGLSSSQGGIDVPEHPRPVLQESIDCSDKKAIEVVLDSFEQKAILEKMETACVITRSGEVYICYGTENRVFPDVDLGEKLLGAIVSHNHPMEYSEFSFSKADFELFNDYHLEVLRGVDVKYKYEFTRNSAKVDEHISIFDLTEEDTAHEESIMRAERAHIGYRRWLNE